MERKKIFVTKPALPPLEEYQALLAEIWESRILTNSGPFHDRLELELAEYLGVPHVVLFNNATIALIAALKVLGLSGEVITTPFSFVATSGALKWCGLVPVFVDVDPKTGNIDSNLIPKAITEETAGILPVHCYGNPCETEKIDEIAAASGLRVLYDAAHLFGSNEKIRSTLLSGDMSVLSFHATKVFNTFEGGCVIVKDQKTADLLAKFRNFGLDADGNVALLGINGKLNEPSSALGLLNLKHINKYIKNRQEIDSRYRELIGEIGSVEMLPNLLGEFSCHSYFPIRFRSGGKKKRDKVYNDLRERGLMCRKYFYPLLSSMAAFKGDSSDQDKSLPVAQKLANEILCLPIYPDLEGEDISRIVYDLKKSISEERKG
jgi:dTDP-4-amino-4,6-dideoxygalactose transaminase